MSPRPYCHRYQDRRKAMLTALNEYAEVYNTYLYYSGKASDRDITVAETDIDTAKSEYEAALKVFKTYSNYPREKDLNTAQLKVENSQTTYNRRNIKATINGVVTHLDCQIEGCIPFFDKQMEYVRYSEESFLRELSKYFDNVYGSYSPELSAEQFKLFTSNY